MVGSSDFTKVNRVREMGKDRLGGVGTGVFSPQPEASVGISAYTQGSSQAPTDSGPFLTYVLLRLP